MNDESIIGPTPNWVDYEHMHLLIRSLNASWGHFLAEQPISGTIITKEYSITLDTDWDANQCAVIAIVLDADTYEILQVEEAYIQ